MCSVALVKDAGKYVSAGEMVFLLRDETRLSRSNPEGRKSFLSIDAASGDDIS